ncbi:MAG: Unknown protein [uncultured Sulfurovum sp.]|uniref:Histidine phosphatase family protein n=1 Tax=uncultured Sulfurovum sp. TaxID=269237 RepID=A0A6S6TPK2_9BACT|nr:MAG: Unknown protein [uncultured Sulfurovum sp.]
MKKIIFIRHAKVDVDMQTPITSSMLKNWEDNYNTANIVQELPLDNNSLIKVFESADYILCSTLSRTKASVELLGFPIDEKNPIFNEFTIPQLHGTWLKLKPTYWLVLFRFYSLLGIGRWARILKRSKKDALDASQRLSLLSQEHQTIILVGHGVMNWMIGKELKRVGWQSEGKGSHKNFGITTLTLENKS